MNEQILIVDDNKVDNRLLTKILKPLGYSITNAFTGEEALEAAARTTPDLILLDIQMPGLDGYEVCRKLKNDKGTKKIPIIFTTALTAKEDQVQALKLGAEDFITKPYGKEEAILRIENILRLRRVQNELKDTVENQTLLLDHIDPMIWYLKDAETIGKVNRSFQTFFNKTPKELENAVMQDFLKPEEAKKVIHSNQKVFDEKTKISQKHWIQSGHGEKRLIAVTKTPKINEQGEVDYVICSAEDITERNRKAERLKRLTFYDPLTDLYNRAFYEEELKRMDVERNLPLSVMIGDVNGLKLANDIFGHQTGDRLLKEVAKVLRQVTRKDDIIARWGGDEFVMLLPKTTEKDTAKIADRIHELLDERAVGLIPLSMAIGFATKEESRQHTRKIIKKAEDRMYRNKTDIKDEEENPLLERFTTKFYGREYRDIHHTPKIQQAGKLLGSALGLSEAELQRFRLLIKYHDIGKLSVPTEILNKGRSLTDGEWEQYKNHVEIGYRIADTFRSISSIAEEILYHHEHYDGNGFPGKLQGEEIPVLARMMLIVDFYDGLRSNIYYPLEKDRYFKEPLSQEAAIEELKKRSGTFFDPEILQVFIEQVIPQIREKVDTFA